jgi:hypothetical protein
MDKSLEKLHSTWGQSDHSQVHSRANFADLEGHRHDSRKHVDGMWKGERSR